MRDWVEKQSLTNTVPKGERVFVGTDAMNSSASGYAVIVPYHKGVTLRQIIDQTPLKDKRVYISVMRPGATNDPKSFPIFGIPVKPTANPNFEVKPLDLIWIYDHVPIF